MDVYINDFGQLIESQHDEPEIETSQKEFSDAKPQENQIGDGILKIVES